MLRGERSPRGRGVGEQPPDVDGLAPAGARRAGEIVERERRPAQLEVDRLDPGRALEAAEREPRHGQRPTHLVLRPRRLQHTAATAGVQRRDDEDPRQVHDHPHASSTRRTYGHWIAAADRGIMRRPRLARGRPRAGTRRPRR